MTSKRFGLAAVVSMVLAHLLAADLAAQGQSNGHGGGGSGVHGAPGGRHGPSFRPTGWDKGHKDGWGGCDQPPGLARKSGCKSSDEPGVSEPEPENGGDDAPAPPDGDDGKKEH
jgi:hypothetical protein